MGSPRSWRGGNCQGGWGGGRVLVGSREPSLTLLVKAGRLLTPGDPRAELLQWGLSRPLPSTGLSHGHRPQPRTLSHGYGTQPWIQVSATDTDCGHGHGSRPWTRVSATDTGLSHGHRSRHGHGSQPWIGVSATNMCP